MMYSLRARGGMCTAPHHLAASSGRRILESGGTAIEAMVAAAATIAVVYPHMNSVGGDGFWLIKAPGRLPVAIHATGPSAGVIDVEGYRSKGSSIHARGGASACTVAGTVSGWQSALDLLHNSPAVDSFGLGVKPEQRMPLSELLADAVQHARKGVPVTDSFVEILEQKRDELARVPGFAETYLSNGDEPVRPGELLYQPRLADSLETLSREGLDSFYRGDLARRIAKDLESVGSPLRLSDLAGFRASVLPPLTLRTSVGQFWNTSAPTQGAFSLALLGVFDRLKRYVDRYDSVEYVHALVEATKVLFAERDRSLADPRVMQNQVEQVLAEHYLSEVAREIARTPSGFKSQEVGGDTVYLAAVDQNGTAVSFIQSVYWEFGSGVVLPETGILWQNRGVSFSLDPRAVHYLRPNILPRHTLNPALVETPDGAVTAYGTMGGDGQPQTQAAIATRVFWYGQGLQEAISSPRWLFGRTWGDASSNLKIETGYNESVVAQLQNMGHAVEWVPRFSSMLGHASAIRRLPNATLEGAVDPRSDGSVAAC